MKSIREYLIDLLRSTRLYEMARSQSDCEDIVRHQIRNILENLVLTQYFLISELPTRNLDHWRSELVTSIYNASDFSVKKDNSIKRRKRIVNRVFDEEDMLDYSRIYNRVILKFEKEKETQKSLDEFKEWIDQAIVSSINQMQDIMELIAVGDPIGIKKWVNEVLK